MGFFRQEHWSGLPCPPPGDLSDPGSNPHLLYLLNWQMGSLLLVPPGEPKYTFMLLQNQRVTVIWQKNLDTLILLSFQKKFKQNNLFVAKWRPTTLWDWNRMDRKTQCIENRIENMNHLFCGKTGCLESWEGKKKSFAWYFKFSLPVVSHSPASPA